jgi:prophage antirepressor-like protein
MSKIVEFRSPAGALLRQVSESEQADLWFVAKDVCEALGLHVGSAMKRIPERHKGSSLMQTPGGPQRLGTVSEQGLYRLALRSRKPEAIAFSEWVTDEVLPEIRRSGSYRAQSAPVDHKALLADLLSALVPIMLDAVDKRIDAKLERLSVGTIRPWEAGAIKRRLLDAAKESERIGNANAKSARKSFELRLRTACGWDGSGARIANMPVDRIGIADRELTAIERDLQRAAERADRQTLSRQPSLFEDKNESKKKPN